MPELIGMWCFWVTLLNHPLNGSQLRKERAYGTLQAVRVKPACDPIVEISIPITTTYCPVGPIRIPAAVEPTVPSTAIWSGVIADK